MAATLASCLLPLLATGALAGTVPADPGSNTVPEPPGYRLDDYRAPVPATVAGGRVLHTSELRALLDSQADGPVGEKTHAILIDVLPVPRRPAGMSPGTPWMPLSHTDLPGSVWLPEVGRGALAPAIESWFRQQLSELTTGDKGRTLIFYCQPECWMSWNAAKRAAGYGYTNIIWYPDGVEGWRAAGLPLAPATAIPPPEASPGTP
ncbi:MAG: PQQ-dependent catabolism-associated CXXCW motif protein [Azospirillaceae bacterium]|nr:PQQ-dependent catabolism-associated CXXCW motif protein [Azospirillaceae bacterium]